MGLVHGKEYTLCGSGKFKEMGKHLIGECFLVQAFYKTITQAKLGNETLVL